jgi:alpha-methylacyl-CoA racemase
MSALAGVRVVEFDAIGPAPFCGKLLADHGASVIRVGRPGGQPNGISAGDADPLLQGRPTLPLDLKNAADCQRVFDLLDGADMLIEGYRPGVMERLGFGPDEVLGRNPRLIYGRITGYGQTGTLALHPGHDINYIALTGALHAIGSADQPPPPPLNLVGDYGGGAMLLAFGLLAAHLRALRTGLGQVVDAAMLDATLQLMSPVFGWMNAGMWSMQRETNFLDGSAPFYRTYRTADGRFLAVGAIEPKFYAAFRQALGLSEPMFDAQMDRASWPAMRTRIAQVVASRTLDGWRDAIAVQDACLSPVLSCDLVASHPHVLSRKALQRDPDGNLHVAAAPRLSLTPAAMTSRSLDDLLAEWPLTATQRDRLREGV